jgi:peroxiredoxin
VGVNHGSAESHETFRKELELPFPLLVDTDMEVAKTYGAVKEDGSGISRSVVVVGTDGTVVFASPGAPAHALVINAVRAASGEGARS